MRKKIACPKCAAAEARLQEQEARFLKAKNEFEAAARKMLDDKQQQERTIVNLRRADENRRLDQTADEGRRVNTLEAQVRQLQTQVTTLKSELERERALTKHPEAKDGTRWDVLEVD
jgi:hypothetical protein